MTRRTFGTMRNILCSGTKKLPFCRFFIMEQQIVTIIALIVSIILHEMAHGFAANAMGDPTARLQGRLSPNPLVHIDLLGSIIIPGLLLFSNAGLLFGWAKPVPYNPYNLKAPWGLPAKASEALVAAAGPATNLLLAFIFAMVYRSGEMFALSSSFLSIAWAIVFLNILLAMFNMIPIPPLDGSKILMVFLPANLQYKYRQLVQWTERYGLFAMFAFIFIFINFFSQPFFIFVSTLTGLATGTNGL